MPDAGPALVRPAQAEREIGLTAVEHLAKRALQHAATGEPIMVVAEPLDAMLAGEIGLRGTRLGDPQIVEAEVGRQAQPPLSALSRRS